MIIRLCFYWAILTLANNPEAAAGVMELKTLALILLPLEFATSAAEVFSYRLRWERMLTDDMRDRKKLCSGVSIFLHFIVIGISIWWQQ